MLSGGGSIAGEETSVGGDVVLDWHGCGEGMGVVGVWWGGHIWQGHGGGVHCDWRGIVG